MRKRRVILYKASSSVRLCGRFNFRRRADVPVDLREDCVMFAKGICGAEPRVVVEELWQCWERDC